MIIPLVSKLIFGRLSGANLYVSALAFWLTYITVYSVSTFLKIYFFCNLFFSCYFQYISMLLPSVFHLGSNVYTVCNLFLIHSLIYFINFTHIFLFSTLILNLLPSLPVASVFHSNMALCLIRIFVFPPSPVKLYFTLSMGHHNVGTAIQTSFAQNFTKKPSINIRALRHRGRIVQFGNIVINTIRHLPEWQACVTSQDLSMVQTFLPIPAYLCWTSRQTLLFGIFDWLMIFYQFPI